MHFENSNPLRGQSQRMVRKHLVIGWISLLVFMTLGVILETLYAFHIQFYVSVNNETRHLMWTLAHAHGTFLSLVHLVFAGTVWLLASCQVQISAGASKSLTVGALLVPAGFFLGGLYVHGTDPNLSILLVPVGALCLLATGFLAARAVLRVSKNTI